MVDKLKDEPQKFEVIFNFINKIKFFNDFFHFRNQQHHNFKTSLFKEYCLPDLAKLGVMAVKNKMRNLKDSFVKAEEWRGQTGAGILEEGKEDDVKGE